MARDKANWKQAGGYWATTGGEGDTLHTREEFVIKGLANPEVALVIRLYADRWVTTVERWKGTNR